MSKELKHKIYTSTDCISEDVMYNYIDKKLSAQEEHQVEKHLIDCELCSDALEGLTISHDRKTINSIKTTVDKQLLANEKTTKIIRINYKTVWGIAAGLLLLIGGVFFFNQFMTKNMEMADASKLETTEEEKSPQLDVAEIKADSIQPIAPSSAAREIIVQEKETNKQEIAFIAPKTKLEDAQDILENKATAGNAASGATENYYKQVRDEEIAIETNEGIASAPDLKKAETSSTTSKTDDNQQTFAWTSAPVSVSTKEEAKDKTIVLSKKSVEKQRSKTNEKPAPAQQSAYNNLDVSLAETTVATEQKNTLELDQDDQLNFKKLSAADSTIVVEEMPKFPGGEIELVKYIAKNFKYPATNSNFSKTKIYIEFIIDKNGTVKNAKIIKGISPDLDKEALRVINAMPKWNPGKQAGKPVDVKMYYPIQLEFK